MILPSLSSSQLKHAAFLLGLPSTGTKSVLEPLIASRVCDPLEPVKGGRIVSVDMGIRNLAYCVLEYPDPSATQPSKSAGKPLKVTAWKKKDLLQESVATSKASDLAKERKRKASATEGKGRSEGVPITGILKDAFTPSALSKTACTLTKDLLSYSPTAILIERQRFRSGGAAAIQEWTVRVNMLESMMWACLQTMREERPDDQTFPDMHEVNPARVANFWAAGPEIGLRPSTDFFPVDGKAKAGSAITKSSRSKVQKKDKIAIVRSWLDGNGSADVPLTFGGQASQVAEAFRTQPKQRGRKAKTDSSGITDFGKLDDLADCLLQAVAWVRWEQNAQEMMGLLRKRLEDRFRLGYTSVEGSEYC